MIPPEKLQEWYELTTTLEQVANSIKAIQQQAESSIKPLQQQAASISQRLAALHGEIEAAKAAPPQPPPPPSE